MGTPIAGRSQRETEHLIGCFVNTLVIRTDLSGNPAFQEVLRRVREVALDAYAHQHVPFEQVVEAIQPERDMSRSPLVQVMFVLQNAPLVPLELPNAQARLIEIDPGTAKFDLSLTLAEAGAELIGTLEYSSDLFEATTIARMVEQFTTLLTGIVVQPHVCLAALPLLSMAEQHQLHAWSAAQTSYPTAQCLHQLFAAQAARSPDAVAVVFDGPGVRGQGSRVRETRETRPAPRGNEERQGDKETRSQESGVRSQESEFLAPNPSPPPALRLSSTPLPPPARGGTEGYAADEVLATLPPPVGGGTEGGRGWTSMALSPQSSVLSPQSLGFIKE